MRSSGRQLPALDLYRELLRLVYRLLFLMVAEERKLLFLDDPEKRERQEIYTRWYSIERLRARAEARHGDDPYPDLWQGLIQTFRLFREERHAQKLGLGVLDGELFGGPACRFVERAQIRNDVLLDAIFQLSTFEETVGRRRGGRRRVAFSHLDVEELGSVYESLLDFRPDVSLAPARFDLLSGTERKTTGSYYTPRELVTELIKSALEPVVEERLAAAKTPGDKERALLDLRVCDPAAGSGHFLLAAARRLGRELARVRTGEAEPPPSHYRRAVRDVVRHCHLRGRQEPARGRPVQGQLVDRRATIPACRSPSSTTISASVTPWSGSSIRWCSRRASRMPPTRR